MKSKNLYLGKTITVRLADQIIDYIVYRTKTEAYKQYRFWLRHGKCDPLTGLVINGATFELA